MYKVCIIATGRWAASALLSRNQLFPGIVMNRALANANSPCPSPQTVPRAQRLVDAHLQSMDKKHFFSILIFFYLQTEKNNSGNILSGTRSLVSAFEFYCCLEISHRIFRVYDVDLAAGQAMHLQLQTESEKGNPSDEPRALFSYLKSTLPVMSPFFR